MDAERVALESARFVATLDESSPRTLASGLTRSPREQADTAQGECNESTLDDRENGGSAGLPGPGQPSPRDLRISEPQARRSDVTTSFGAGPDVGHLAFGSVDPPAFFTQHRAGGVMGRFKTGSDDKPTTEEISNTDLGLISVDGRYGRV